MGAKCKGRMLSHPPRYQLKEFFTYKSNPSIVSSTSLGLILRKGPQINKLLGLHKLSWNRHVSTVNKAAVYCLFILFIEITKNIPDSSARTENSSLILANPSLILPNILPPKEEGGEEVTTHKD